MTPSIVEFTQTMFGGWAPVELYLSEVFKSYVIIIMFRKTSTCVIIVQYRTKIHTHCSRGHHDVTHAVMMFRDVLWPPQLGQTHHGFFRSPEGATGTFLRFREMKNHPRCTSNTRTASARRGGIGLEECLHMKVMSGVLTKRVCVWSECDLPLGSARDCGLALLSKRDVFLFVVSDQGFKKSLATTFKPQTTDELEWTALKNETLPCVKYVYKSIYI